MNHAQHKMMHVLLTKTGLMKDKANIVLGITNGRSESRKDLSFDEARLMINYLKTQDKETVGAERMRKKMISMAHEMHWHSPLTPEGETKPKVDMSRLNNWCEKFGYLHKKLNDYNYIELPKLVTQFTNVYKDFIDKI